jgi:hypothetical protein
MLSSLLSALESDLWPRVTAFQTCADYIKCLVSKSIFDRLLDTTTTTEKNQVVNVLQSSGWLIAYVRERLQRLDDKAEEYRLQQKRSGKKRARE